jgi:hypothetical protein
MIYNPYFEKYGIDAIVMPMGVTAEDYAEGFRSLFRLTNIRGALITMPHKITTIPLLDEVSCHETYQKFRSRCARPMSGAPRLSSSISAAVARCDTGSRCLMSSKNVVSLIGQNSRLRATPSLRMCGSSAAADLPRPTAASRNKIQNLVSR